MGKLIDLSGKKFGSWTVLGRDKSWTGRQIKWNCVCDCQKGLEHPKIYSIYGTNLKRGLSTKCEKCRTIVVSQKIKQYNTYDLSGEYGIGYTSDNKEFWFDKEDYDKIKNYYWRFDADGYVVANSGGKNNSTIRIHRIIMDVTNSKMQVDHIKHNLYDNRKSQLRLVTNGQNGMNKDKPSNNTSGHIGVSFNKKRKMWEAYIRCNNEYIHLGIFEKYEDAVEKRLIAEKEYFKEYAYDYSQAI